MLIAKPCRTLLQPVQKSTTIANFTGRLLIIAVIIVLAFAAWRLIDIFVLLFGAILLAIGLCAATRQVVRWTKVRRVFALVGVFVIATCIMGAAFWVFGATVAAQIDDVARAAPAGFKLFTAWMTSNSYGRLVIEQVRGANVMGATGWATSMIATTFGLVTRAFGYAVVALFVAIYLAAQPELYRHLSLRLVPPEHRLAASQLLDTLGDILQRWLAGQLVVMVVIGVLSGIGLRLMGIEAAFALGLMGGLLCFIPFVGAILAAVPATLVALTQGPLYAVWVICMYAGVHFLEGNFITPMVQQQATSFPPVLAILATVAFGILFGPLGVLLATPLMLLAMTAVEILYVQKGLGEAPEQPPAALAR